MKESRPTPNSGQSSSARGGNATHPSAFLANTQGAGRGSANQPSPAAAPPQQSVNPLFTIPTHLHPQLQQSAAALATTGSGASSPASSQSSGPSRPRKRGSSGHLSSLAGSASSSLAGSPAPASGNYQLPAYPYFRTQSPEDAQQWNTAATNVEQLLKQARVEARGGTGNVSPQLQSHLFGSDPSQPRDQRNAAVFQATQQGGQSPQMTIPIAPGMDLPIGPVPPLPARSHLPPNLQRELPLQWHSSHAGFSQHSPSPLHLIHYNVGVEAPNSLQAGSSSLSGPSTQANVAFQGGISTQAGMSLFQAPQTSSGTAADAGQNTPPMVPAHMPLHSGILPGGFALPPAGPSTPQAGTSSQGGLSSMAGIFTHDPMPPIPPTPGTPGSQLIPNPIPPAGVMPDLALPSPPAVDDIPPLFEDESLENPFASHRRAQRRDRGGPSSQSMSNLGPDVIRESPPSGRSSSISDKDIQSLSEDMLNAFHDNDFSKQDWTASDNNSEDSNRRASLEVGNSFSTKRSCSLFALFWLVLSFVYLWLLPRKTQEVKLEDLHTYCEI